MNYVIALLEHTDMSITDICMEAGFQSLRTFHRVFQEKYKKTPREYKNEFKTREVIYQSDEGDDRKKEDSTNENDENLPFI